MHRDERCHPNPGDEGAQPCLEPQLVDSQDAGAELWARWGGWELRQDDAVLPRLGERVVAGDLHQGLGDCLAFAAA